MRNRKVKKAVGKSKQKHDWKRSLVSFEGDQTPTKTYLNKEQTFSILGQLRIDEHLSSNEKQRFWRKICERVPGFVEKQVSLDQLQKELSLENKRNRVQRTNILSHSHSRKNGRRESNIKDVVESFCDFVWSTSRRKLLAFFQTYFQDEHDLDSNFISAEDVTNGIRKLFRDKSLMMIRLEEIHLLVAAKILFREMDRHHRKKVDFEDFFVWATNQERQKNSGKSVLDFGNDQISVHQEWNQSDIDAWKQFDRKAKAERIASLQGILLLIVRNAFWKERKSVQSKTYENLVQDFGNSPTIRSSKIKKLLRKMNINLSERHFSLFLAMFNPTGNGKEINAELWFNLILSKHKSLLKSDPPRSNILWNVHRTAFWSLSNYEDDDYESRDEMDDKPLCLSCFQDDKDSSDELESDKKDECIASPLWNFEKEEEGEHDDDANEDEEQLEEETKEEESEEERLKDFYGEETVDMIDYFATEDSEDTGSNSDSNSDSDIYSDLDSDSSYVKDEVENQDEHDLARTIEITALKPSGLKNPENWFLQFSIHPWESETVQTKTWAPWRESRNKSLKRGSRVQLKFSSSKDPMPSKLDKLLAARKQALTDYEQMESSRPHVLVQLFKKSSTSRFSMTKSPRLKGVGRIPIGTCQNQSFTQTLHLWKDVDFSIVVELSKS